MYININGNINIYLCFLITVEDLLKGKGPKIHSIIRVPKCKECGSFWHTLLIFDYFWLLSDSNNTKRTGYPENNPEDLGFGSTQSLYCNSHDVSRRYHLQSINAFALKDAKKGHKTSRSCDLCLIRMRSCTMCIFS